VQVLDVQKSAASQATPEDVMAAMVSSMRAGDVAWNDSLWAPGSLAEMKRKDAATGQDASYWRRVWAEERNDKYFLTNRIEYGKYVMVQFEARRGEGRPTVDDNMIFEKIGGRWYLTQSLAADPVPPNWKSATGRIQVAPDALFNR
jgi:hypothetical protein